MTETEFKNILTNDIKKVEHTLLSFLPDCKDGQESVVQAMEYSLVNGGKRLRPVFTLEFAQACGGNREDALPFACAMEYVHTYSLIHDDLPCMDNDDLRRGKPSCHKAFGEDTALLAGDALLTHAFEIIASSDLSDDKKVSASLLLAQNAGVGGMIGGQVIDLIYEKENPTVKQPQLYAGGKAARIGYMLCLAGGAAVQFRQAVNEVVVRRGYAVVHGEVDDSQLLGHVVAFEELLRVAMCRTEKEYVDFFQRELVGKYQICFTVQSFVYISNFVAGVA